VDFDVRGWHLAISRLTFVRSSRHCVAGAHSPGLALASPYLSSA
jgi:hypothetical protein